MRRCKESESSTFEAGSGGMVVTRGYIVLAALIDLEL
jgi:hypothetical protein